MALAALEIGGGNGMINMITGSSDYLNLPVLDGDFMVRFISSYRCSTVAGQGVPYRLADHACGI